MTSVRQTNSLRHIMRKTFISVTYEYKTGNNLKIFAKYAENMFVM